MPLQNNLITFVWAWTKCLGIYQIFNIYIYFRHWWASYACPSMCI